MPLVRLKVTGRIRCTRKFSLVSRTFVNSDPSKRLEKEPSSLLESSQNGLLENGVQNNALYCLDLVRKYEYENFLCVLLLSDVNIRSFIFAVRAFNVEVALIRDQVSQRDIGLGRLTFWKSAVDSLYKKKGNSSAADIPRHPVVQELHRAIGSKQVSKKWMVNLLDARERIMNDAAFKTVEELEAYCDKSVSPLLYLGFEALGVKNVDADHAASHLGKSIGLANFIRSIPYNSQRRRVLLPQELLSKHKLSQENFIRFTNQEKIRDAVFEIASQAHTHYQKAATLKSKVPKEALPLMLIGTPTELYLKKLEKLQFNPYDSTLNQRDSLLPLRLYYRKLIRHYF